MNISLFGSQVSKFRRERNMTQEELGRAVGVSTQAVSRWECGGAPDITLLPAIADTLHVTIDTLFGREGGEPVDMLESVRRWAASLPREQFLDAMVQLSWAGIPALLLQQYGIEDVGRMEHAEVSYNGKRTLSRSTITMDSGILMGSYARDFNFMLTFPEPEEGYGAFLLDNGQYRGLFEVLSRPHVLEILLVFAAEKERFMVASSMAKRMGLSVEEVGQVMEAMTEQKLLTRMELELESGVTRAYCAERTHVLIVFLYFARYLCQGGDVNHVGGFIREKPWLRKGKVQKGEKE